MILNLNNNININNMQNNTMNSIQTVPIISVNSMNNMMQNMAINSNKIPQKIHIRCIQLMHQSGSFNINNSNGSISAWNIDNNQNKILDAMGICTII